MKKSSSHSFFNVLLGLFAVLLYMAIFFGIGFGVGQMPAMRAQVDILLQGLKDASLEAKYPSEFSKSFTVWVDDKAKAHDELILVGAQYKENPAIMLMDRDGKVLHQWQVPNSYTNKAVIEAHHIKNLQEGGYSAIDDAEMLPNGDVIAMQDNRMLANFRGQRLFQMDKDSQIVWHIEGAFHHEFDRTPSGEIYALDSVIKDSYPVLHEAVSKNVRFLHDRIVKISPEGKVIDTIMIPEAFVGTDYAHFINAVRLDLPQLQDFTFGDGTRAFDPIHVNSVQVLDATLAKAMPIAKEGDILISMRGNSVIALLRPQTKKIVWAMAGIWRHQHDVRLQPDGRIRMFDNEGAAQFVADVEGGVALTTYSRILDVMPDGQTKVVYADANNPNLTTYWRGMHKALADGSLLYLSNYTSSMVQLSKEGKIVWELRGIPDRAQVGAAYRQQIAFAKSYAKAYPTFIKKE